MLYNDPTLVEDRGMYATFASQTSRPSSRQNTFLYSLAMLIVIATITYVWHTPSASIAATEAFTSLTTTIRNPVGAMRRPTGPSMPPSKAAGFSSSRPSFNLNSFPKERKSAMSEKPPAAKKWWTPKAPTAASAKVNKKKEAAAKAAAAASGMAVLLTMMTPETAHAVTDVVDAQYLMAAADALHATIKDASSILAHIHTPLPGDNQALVESVTQVYKQTAAELMQLASSDTIGDIPKDGWFESFTRLIEKSILGIDKALTKANVPGSMGISITLFTLGIKSLLFPLNFAQLKSSVQMQAVQPKVKEIQERFAEDKNQMNLLLGELYAKNNVNPLLAIFPAFAQIPVFIGLYRALRNLGQQNQLDQPFLWLPSLEGPVFDLPAGHTLEWLTQGQLSQSDTLAYLSIPAILIATQTLSTQLSKTPGQEMPKWINFLPLLTASFALNVPSGLAVYWIVNTIVTTTTNLGVKAYLKNDAAIIAAGETNLDDLVASSAANQPGAPAPPSYQEALLAAVDGDPELAAAFDEMRSNPSAVMKFYGDKAFTEKLSTAVAAQQAKMLEEQRAAAIAAAAAPIAVKAKVKDNLASMVKAGNMTGVKYFLDIGTDPNYKDEKQISALHYAVGKGSKEMIELLLSKGADINIVDGTGNTLMHYAAGYGKEDMVKLLYKKNVDMNPLNDNRETPMDLAANKENKFVSKDCLKTLESFGAMEGLGFGPVAPEYLDAAAVEVKGTTAKAEEVKDAEFTES